MQEMVQQLQSLQSDRDAVESQARTDKKVYILQISLPWSDFRGMVHEHGVWGLALP